jgi:hypothetical protein
VSWDQRFFDPIVPSCLRQSTMPRNGRPRWRRCCSSPNMTGQRSSRALGTAKVGATANQKFRFRDARASQFRLHPRQPVARINNFLRLFFRPLIIKHKFSCRAKSNASALERIATSDRDGMHRATCAAAGTIYLGPGFAFSVTLALVLPGLAAFVWPLLTAKARND